MKLRSHLNEGKNDYTASYSGVMITIKNGYKNYSEDELEAAYEKFGKAAKECKIKIKSIVIAG